MTSPPIHITALLDICVHHDLDFAMLEWEYAQH